MNSLFALRNDISQGNAVSITLIDTLISQGSACQADMESLKERIAALEQSLSTTQQRLSTSEQKIDTQQVELTDLRPIVLEMHSRAVVGLVGRQFVTKRNGQLTLETRYICNSAAVNKFHETNNTAHKSKFKPSLDALKDLRNAELHGPQFHSYLNLQQPAIFDAVVQKALYCTLARAEMYVQNPQGEVSLRNPFSVR